MSELKDKVFEMDLGAAREWLRGQIDPSKPIVNVTPPSKDGPPPIVFCARLQSLEYTDLSATAAAVDTILSDAARPREPRAHGVVRLRVVVDRDALDSALEELRSAAADGRRPRIKGPLCRIVPRVELDDDAESRAVLDTHREAAKDLAGALGTISGDDRDPGVPGGTVSDAWGAYRDEVMPAEAGVSQVTETRRAFYAGALAVLGLDQEAVFVECGEFLGEVEGGRA